MTAEQVINALELLLLLMRKEHENAHTHSERNAYQQVIRVEIQGLKSELVKVVALGKGDFLTW